MNCSQASIYLILSMFVLIVQGQLKLPREAAPLYYDEEWSEYDKCHFFDPRNEFWDYHHCEYIDCSSSAGSCEDAVDGKWPVMATRYKDGCYRVHSRVPVAPSSSCCAGKMMTLCCTYVDDPERVVKVKPFHKRVSDHERYWPYH